MTNLDVVLANPATMAEWLAKLPAAKYMEWVRLERASADKTLRTSVDIIEIARAQGKIEAFDKILNLPELLAEHQRQVRSGVRKPVSER